MATTPSAALPATALRRILGPVGARVTAAVGRPAFWLVFVAVAMGWPVARMLAFPRPQPPPVLGTVPEFSLVDQQGQVFGSAQLRGRTWVAALMFTRCPTVCPALTDTMREVQHRARNLGDAFHLVSFTVDPGHDTPEVLLAYMRESRAQPHGWSFLTGPEEIIRGTVVDGMKVAMGEAGEEVDPAAILHGTHLVLVDQRLRIRGYYDSGDPEAVDRMLRDAGVLANLGPDAV